MLRTWDTKTLVHFSVTKPLSDSPNFLPVLFYVCVAGTGGWEVETGS